MKQISSTPSKSTEWSESFHLATDFINKSNKNVFLTGRAGTGKTTFLQHLKKNSPKKMVIAAPTGVAAMHAGGTTLHSLFLLPFGTYIADYTFEGHSSELNVYNRPHLYAHMKFPKARRQLLREMELLVIDEVSMVRADLLDAIDTVLQSVRRDQRAFGGVQVLFIGDLFQLPPVVKSSEWNLLHSFYQSPFFFDAHVLQQDPPIGIELTKVYRQSDPVFLDLLYQVRTNTLTEEGLKLLNTHYKPDFIPPKDQAFITLTSHNQKADQINKEGLAALPGKVHRLKAAIQLDFGAGLFPVEEELQLKLGAQVMFVKNDTGEDRRYFNGKIGTVRQIDETNGRILIEIKDQKEWIELKRETWKNIRYQYNQAQDKMDEEVLGTFSQYPIRLAWAITIHKSQGLTFDRAIIDAGASFAAGQVYVALSRLRSLEGLVLYSRILPHSIQTDSRVLAFETRFMDPKLLPDTLIEAQKEYFGHHVRKAFTWDEIADHAVRLKQTYSAKNLPDQQQIVDFWLGIAALTQNQQEVALKFTGQIHRLFRPGQALDIAFVSERVQKASDWFLPALREHLITPLNQHLQARLEKKKAKSYTNELKAFQLLLQRKEAQLVSCLEMSEDVVAGKLLRVPTPLPVAEVEVTPIKSPKGETRRISLDLFKEGLTIDQIALRRDLTNGTVLQHLLSFLGQEILAEDLIDPITLELLLKDLHENSDLSRSEFIQKFAPRYTYDELAIARVVIGIGKA
jgi:hypothetical protein